MYESITILQILNLRLLYYMYMYLFYYNRHFLCVLVEDTNGSNRFLYQPMQAWLFVATGGAIISMIY